MMDTPHHAPDNTSMILWLVREQGRIPYQTVLINRAAGAQDGPAYRALNPAGLFPTLSKPAAPRDALAEGVVPA